FEAIAGKITSDQIPFKQAGLQDPRSHFFRELDTIIRSATAEDKDERLASVKELKKLIKEIVGVGARAISTSYASYFSRKFKSRKTLAVFGTVALLLGLIAGAEIGLFHKPQKSFLSFRQPSLEKPGISKERQEPGGPQKTEPSATLTGTDHSILHLVTGGKLNEQSGAGPETGKQIEVAPFYMDETQVTNYQYAEFLNQVLRRIQVEHGLVLGDGQIWLFLGEVAKGYEPIMFQDGRFHLHGTQNSANPVVRVTGYGAAAYARFVGRRLPAEREWLYLVEKEGKKPVKPPVKTVEGPREGEGMHGMQHESHSPSQLSSLPDRFNLMAVTDEKPDAYGIKGLNGKIGEWGLGIDPSSPEYVVLGGPFSIQDGSSAGVSIKRHPSEAFEEVGFRTVMSLH
ncbi:MAG: SUMF1/EgtB/PvdO family nonheme iron enzyme, partial [Syntrophobacteraceae bacterium]